MSFVSDIYSVLNGETTSNTENSYIIETTDPRSTVEEVRLYEPQRVSYTSSSHEDRIANAMVELSGTRWDQKTDAKVAMTEAVNAYIKNAHTESSWKTFGRLVELAHKKFNFDMQESLKKYNQDQIDLLDMKEAVKLDADIRAGLGGSPDLKDLEIEIHDIDGPRQPQDIWKGEISRGIVGDEIENMGDEPYEKKSLKKESTDLDEGKKEKRQAWMAKAQKAVEKSGGHPGKIDWDSATYLYDTGKSPEDAGKVLAKLQKEEADLDESKMSELHALIKDGKSAKEIAKEMKLDEKTIAQLMKGMKEIEEEEVQIEELQTESKLQKLQKLNTPKEG